MNPPCRLRDIPPLDKGGEKVHGDYAEKRRNIYA